MSERKEGRDARIIALMAAATVGFGLLQGARLVDVNSGPYSASPLALWGLVVDGAVFLVVAALSYTGKVEGWRSLFLVGVVSSAAYVFMAAFAPDDMAMLALMQTFAGLGWSLNILCWMAVFVSYRSRYALPMIAAGYVINVCVQPISSMLVPYDKPFLVVMLFVSIVLLRICLASNEYVARSMRETLIPCTSLSEAFSRTRRAVAGACAFSLVCGFVIQSDLSVRGMGYSQTDTTAGIALVVALAMTAVLIVFRVEKADLDYAFPIAAIFMASAVMVRSTGALDPSVAGSLMTVILISFYVLLWFMLVSEARERMLPPFLLLGAALGAARLSVAAGRGAFVALHESGMAVDGAVDTVALWALVAASSLISFAYLKASSRYRREDRLAERGTVGEGGVCAECAVSSGREALRTECDSPAHSSDTCSEYAASLDSGEIGRHGEASRLSGAASQEVVTAFDEAARRFSFSQRETQVMREYAAGRSARYIAEWCMLSEHTVKTHIRRAYAKAGVHSRQEFLDAIEQVESDLLHRGL